MSTRVKFPLIVLSVVVSSLLLPVAGLPYGDFDWVAQSQPYPPAKGGACVYTVRFGDSLISIANRFGTSISSIAQANGIRNANFIFVGQHLVIPNCRKVQRVTYTVQPGDTLFAIARRFNTTVRAIALENFIANPNRIFVGQRLRITPGGRRPAPKIRDVYRVRPGDNLTLIALRFGTTPSAIAAVNNLQNPSLIFPGQRLLIP